MMIQPYIQKLTTGADLEDREAQDVMKFIMSGQATDSQIAAFLTALHMKGETPLEIAAFTTVMKQFCHRIYPTIKGRLIDTCGTGGDHIKTFNISTTAAFVVAGTNIAVAKHGNRSFTSKSGSADVLERLGVNIQTPIRQIASIIEEEGIGFLFAPQFHPAMKYAITARRDIGIRSVFNILGPLSNPANANAQLLGVYAAPLISPLIHALQKLKCHEAMVVHGLDGLDEASTIGKTRLAWLKDNHIHIQEVAPSDFGLKQAMPTALLGGSPEANAEISFRILYEKNNASNPKKDIVLMNAALGIMVGGKATSFMDGVQLAQDALESGRAYAKLQALVKASRGDPSILEEMESRYEQLS
jgi:anthranilate phosphoribosyltransferase